MTKSYVLKFEDLCVNLDKVWKPIVHFSQIKRKGQLETGKQTYKKTKTCLNACECDVMRFLEVSQAIKFS